MVADGGASIGAPKHAVENDGQSADTAVTPERVLRDRTLQTVESELSTALAALEATDDELTQEQRRACVVVAWRLAASVTAPAAAGLEGSDETRRAVSKLFALKD